MGWWTDKSLLSLSWCLMIGDTTSEEGKVVQVVVIEQAIEDEVDSVR